MNHVALVLSLLVAGVGALGVAAPARLLDLVRRFQTPRGLYFAAAIRVIFGVALFLAAPASRAPGVIRILGAFTAAVGLVTPAFGLARYRRLLDWWSSRGEGFVRAWAAVALVFGLLLVYALFP